MYAFDEGYKRVLGIDLSGVPGMTDGVAAAPTMRELLNLSGKTAIVTGGAMGLGFCIVNRLVEAGANVVVADLAEEYAEKNFEFLSSKGYSVKFIKTDISDPKQIDKAVAFAKEQFGHIDILVNNASVWQHCALSEITEESFQKMIDVNLKGTLFFVKAVAAVMEEQGTGGKIVNIASNAAYSNDPGPFEFEYVSSKAGVLALTRSLVRALKPIGVNINCVLPGGMVTAGAINTKRTAKAEELKKNLPRVPVADPDEVARVVFMLTTDIASFMHGAEVLVDGGDSLHVS